VGICSSVVTDCGNDVLDSVGYLYASGFRYVLHRINSCSRSTSHLSLKKLFCVLAVEISSRTLKHALNSNVRQFTVLNDTTKAVSVI